MNTPIDYNVEFDKAMLLLNHAQREAVEHIEGPVMVLAGPGTGKTHLLSARIGNILKCTDALPSNILCLSFTDAGVKAMRDRLLTLIGPDAHKIHLFTYHAFCNTVIKENTELFGQYDLELISEIEQNEIVEKILDGLPYNHPLVKNINVPYVNRKRLLNLFRSIKTEGWTIAFLKECIETYIAGLPEDETFRYQVNRAKFKKGDLKQDAIDHVLQQMTVLGSAIDLYPVFTAEMRKRNRYDYDDMILWVNQAFAKEERVLRNYQEKYQYLLVDEFQDTNGSQNQLLKHLTSYWDNPNVFIVGDDDQSIYEFQGAMLKSMVDFYRDYQAFVKVVILTENYRSSQHILDASAALIRHNQHRIVHEIESHNIDKQLVAQNPLFKDSQTPVQLNQFENHYQEVIHVVDQIISLAQMDVPLNEIAVIFANHQQSIFLQQYLTHCQIPFETKRKVNILHEPMIIHWMTLLEYLSQEYQQPHSGQAQLYKLFHHPCWGISQNALDCLLDNHQNDLDQNWIDMLMDQTDEGFIKFVEFRATMLRAMGGEALTSVLEKSLNLSGMLSWATRQENVSWQLSILNTFNNYCTQEILKSPKLSLIELLAGIKNLEDHQIRLEREQFISNQNAVQLVTAHSSKGLEYTYVFLLDVMESAWAKSGNSSNFKLPSTITLSTATDETEASRRLFFVAITRAKKFLQIGLSKHDSKGKPAKKLEFIDEITNIPSTEYREIVVSNEKVQALQLGLLQTRKQQPQRINAKEISKILEHFSLNVHALQSYLRCPLSFYYDHILKLPARMVPATIFGKALHSWLEWLFKEMKQDPAKNFGSLDQSIAYYQRQIERKKGLLNATEYERYLQQGKALVQAYYLQHLHHWHKKVDVELNIHKVTIDGVPVAGVIDKIEYDDFGNPTIVDYKSGSFDVKKLAGIKTGSAGGDYRRQLWFYKLLYESYRPNGPKVKAGIIAYLQTSPDGNFPQKAIELDGSEEALVRELITGTYQKIMQMEFQQGCGKPDCNWCNFVKHHTIDTFAEEDLLDD